MTDPAKRADRQRVTRERILTCAVALLDAEGAGALSMRRLASEVGIEAMSLYHHFPNKEAILGGVIETIMAEALAASHPPTAGGDWRTMMREGIGLVRRAMLAHPAAAPLLLGSAYHATETATWLETPLRILSDAGFSGTELIAAFHAISSYAFGWHILAADERFGVWHGPTDAVDVAPQAATEVTRSLARSLGDWSFGFEDGLDILLDGLEQRRRSA